MDSNENEQCCYTNGTHPVPVAVIGVDCKARCAAKYQNHFNNNNLIEQENLMPPVHDRVPGGLGPDNNPQSPPPPPNGHGPPGGGEPPAKEKVLAENGSIRHISSIFLQSGSSPVSAGSDAGSADRLHDSFTPNGTTSFNTLTNASPTARIALSNGSAQPPDEPPNAENDPRNELAAPVDDENELSDNNSLGNLSYGSEDNGLIDELILLPNNAFSDDDNASTSDDCIYAYRGGEPGGAAGQLLDLQGDLPPDDETDFLEMDFDPEPSSEMENFNRHQPDFLLALDDEHEKVDGGSPRGSPALPARVTSPSAPLQQESEGEESETGSRQVPEMGERREGPCTSPAMALQQTDTVDGSSPGRSSAQTNTGAIPKSLPIPTAGPSGRSGEVSTTKNIRLDLEDDAHLYGHRPYSATYGSSYKLAETFGASSIRPNDRQEDGEDAHCLDCAEQEFLMQTKPDPTRPRLCKACRATKGGSGKSDHRLLPQPQAIGGRGFYARGNHMEGLFHREPPVRKRDEAGRQTVEKVAADELLDLRAEQIVFETLHKINALKEMPAECARSTDQQQQQKLQPQQQRREGKPNVPLNVPEAEEDEVESGQPFHRDDGPSGSYCRELSEQSVVIFTVNCEKQTIMEAMMEIGITPNVDVLRQYFSEQYDVDTTKMTIPQYLLHMSKRDCNYKKLIDAIKSCCDPDALLDFQYFPLDPFSDAPEAIQISSCEIAKRWTANTNLRQIIHFKHKHFHTLNVLGKIVNILRQPSRGRHTNHSISIPRYYKSGCIRIRRIG